ncbi:MAG: dihydroorotate dehydrogenase-like protein [Nitriliruptoraceae bacterium]
MTIDDDALAGAGVVVPAGPGGRGAFDLQVDYLGLELRCPVVASASPLTGTMTSLEALNAAGVGAVVLPSVFEEQLEHEMREVDRYLGLGADVNPEATFGYAPVLDRHNDGSEHYLDLVKTASAALDIPVIASINGSTPGGWIDWTRMLVDAGAAAIELNVYQVAADMTKTGADIERQTLDVVASVVDVCDVPVAVKIAPYWSSFSHFATQLVDAGAAGLVLFNRFFQPDIDLDSLAVERRLKLSNPEEKGLPLLWMAILRGRVDASLAATTGIHEPADALKLLLAGADVVMTTSALLHHGPSHVTTLVDGIRSWATERDYASVRQLTGSVSQASVADPAAFERANYLEALTRFASSFPTAP